MENQIENFILSAEEIEDLETRMELPSRVSYTGQDFDVYGLVRRLNNGTIIIPKFGESTLEIETAGFQRGFVWKKSQMDRFIESILLEFPIPGIFLVKQSDNKNLVLDGQQRLTTLKKYLDNDFPLGNTVLKKYQGKKFRDLDESDKRILEDTSIQTTTLISMPEMGDMRAIYQIFERINSGGTQLTAHEIRMALYAGPIVDFIQDLNLNTCWREIYGPQNPRVRDHELISRIISMYMNWEEYKKPLKSFINDFYVRNHHEVLAETNRAGELFLTACELLNESIGSKSIRRNGKQVNNAWSDALFVGLMNRIDKFGKPEISIIEEKYDLLLESDDLSKSITGSTSDDTSVTSRMKESLSIFLGNSQDEKE